MTEKMTREKMATETAESATMQVDGHGVNGGYSSVPYGATADKNSTISAEEDGRGKAPSQRGVSTLAPPNSVRAVLRHLKTDISTSCNELFVGPRSTLGKFCVNLTILKKSGTFLARSIVIR